MSKTITSLLIAGTILAFGASSASAFAVGGGIPKSAQPTTLQAKQPIASAVTRTDPAWHSIYGVQQPTTPAQQLTVIGQSSAGNQVAVCGAFSTSDARNGMDTGQSCPN